MEQKFLQQGRIIKQKYGIYNQIKLLFVHRLVFCILNNLIEIEFVNYLISADQPIWKLKNLLYSDCFVCFVDLLSGAFEIK